MKTLFPIVICISTSVCWVDGGAAQPFTAQNSPPARYTSTPKMPVEDNVVSLLDVQVHCKAMGAILPDSAPYLLGCQKIVAAKCVIYRVDDDSVKNHELAHCNGWPGNHPSEAELRKAEAIPRGRMIGDVWCQPCSADGSPAPPLPPPIARPTIPWPSIEYLRKKYHVEDQP
jgi:hypothetical protein